MHFCQGNKKLPDSTAGALWLQFPWAGRERKRGALGQWTKRAKATGARAPEPGGRSPRQPRGRCAHTALSKAGNWAYGTEHSTPMERLNSSLYRYQLVDKEDTLTWRSSEQPDSSRPWAHALPSNEHQEEKQNVDSIQLENIAPRLSDTTGPFRNFQKETTCAFSSSCEELLFPVKTQSQPRTLVLTFHFHFFNVQPKANNMKHFYFSSREQTNISFAQERKKPDMAIIPH